LNINKIILFSIGPIISALIGLITIPLLTWYFTPADIGRFELLKIAVSFAILFFSLGLDQAYVREYHEFENKDRLFKSVITPGIFALLILFVTIFLCFPAGSVSIWLFDLNSFLLSSLVMLSVISVFMTRYISLIFRMEERGLIFSISQFLPKAILLIFLLVLYFKKFDADIFDLILFQAMAFFLAFLIFGIFTYKNWISALTQKIKINEMEGLFKFGLPLVLGSVAFWGLIAIDKIFLRMFSTFEELGLYSVAVGIASIAVIFQTVFSTIWGPLVYKWSASNINYKLVEDVTDYVLGFVVFLLVACMGYPLFYTLSEATVVGINIKRKTYFSMLASCLALIVNILGNYILIPIYGAKGAATSTIVSFWFFLFFRTEFSNLVWYKFPRFKIYLLTFIIMLITIGFLFKGSEHPILFRSIWLACLIILCGLYWKVLKIFFMKKSFIKRRPRKRNDGFDS